MNAENVVRCYKKYIGFSVENPPTQKQFLLNMDDKMLSAEFLNDTKDLLKPEENFNPQQAYSDIKELFIEKI